MLLKLSQWLRSLDDGRILWMPSWVEVEVCC
jgi:hypothetical protein